MIAKIARPRLRHRHEAAAIGSIKTTRGFFVPRPIAEHRRHKAVGYLLRLPDDGLRPLLLARSWLLSGRKLSSNETIDRQWSRATDDESPERREVQEVSFIAGRPKLRAGSGDGLQLDRTESVG